MLQFQNFQKAYGSKLIIAAEALTLDGPFYWLKGGNGSGKTTLLQSVAGIIPFRGKIEVGGKTAQAQASAYRLAVNVAAAEPQYPDFLSGYDLIRLYTQTKKGTQEQAAELIAHFGVGDFVRDKIGTYSSGMKKKLSLMLAFIGSPELILLDEPLITLDVAATALLIELISQRLSAGVQLLITSHQEITAPFSIVPRPLLIVNRQLIISS